MRARPFIAAGDQPRKFSDIRAERAGLDALARRRDAMRDQIVLLEGEARTAEDPAERQRLQCEAEGLRAALDGR